MKNLFNMGPMIILVVLMCLFNTSCKEMCYECTGYDDGTTSLEDLGTICSGGDNGTGGTIANDEELHEAVTLYIALGGTCVMK